MREMLERFRGGESVLVEYNPLGHPEVFFYEALNYYRERGLPILIVDIMDTLHVFNEHLKLAGLQLPLDELDVLKEDGRVRLGNILGEVSSNEEFSYHAARYSKTVKPFFMAHQDELKIIFVLGMEKFIYPFQHDPKTLERYFETIERPLIAPENKVTFLFINRDVVTPRALKSMEADKSHIIELDGEVRLVKAPGVVP